jgi:hypothetical protein
MAEKATKKTVAILIKRERQSVPRIIVTSGFKLRPDKGTGLLDVYLESSVQRGERISVDTVLLRTNLGGLKRYAASTTFDQEDAAQKEDVAVPEHSSFANIVHFSQMGGRAETVFGVFSLSDWVEATRQTEGSKTPEIKSFDSVVAISTAGLQKKLLLEMIVILGQQAEE